MNRFVVVTVALLALTSCAERGSGTVRIRVSGEGPAVSGYPFDDGGETIAFADGWSIGYTKVLVSIAEPGLRTRRGSDAEVTVDAVVVDLHQGDATVWEIPNVAARRWDRVSYLLTPPTVATRLADGVLADDAERMRTSALSVLVEGVASKGATTIPFSFGIPDVVRAYDCENGDDGTAGIVVRDSAVETVEFTIHLDHFFLDSIAAAEPSMRFEGLAARAGADGILTLDDLATIPVTDVVDLAGQRIVVDGSVFVYDPGPFPLDEARSIASYVRANATTLGHMNGEGHCRYAVSGSD